jgi:hypothetical protein
MTSSSFRLRRGETQCPVMRLAPGPVCHARTVRAARRFESHGDLCGSIGVDEKSRQFGLLRRRQIKLRGAGELSLRIVFLPSVPSASL